MNFLKPSLVSRWSMITRYKEHSTLINRIYPFSAFSSMPTLKSKAIIYKKFGDPRQNLELSTLDVSTEPKEGEVLVQWIASPVNPLDINRVQGNYAIREELPVIGGSEGVGRVVKTGSGSKLKEGDLVTLIKAMRTPFWSQYTTIDEDELYKFDRRLPLDLAATFTVNPPTAWVMLKHYVDLSKGDYVIQNSANSGVGRSVIQLCKAWGIKTINIVRSRKDIGQLKTELWKIGADHVFTEEEFESDGRKFVKTLSAPPKLALNGVGGKSVLRISSVLERGGTCIVYGGMSKQAHQFSTSAIVFNDLRVRGVAIGMWVRQSEGNERQFEKCLEDLQKLAIEGKLTAIPMDRVRVDEFKTAISRSMEGGHPKQLIVFHEEFSKL